MQASGRNGTIIPDGKVLGLLSFLLLFALQVNAQEAKKTELPFPESAYASVDGVSYHFRRFVPEEEVERKGCVLLIHGFASSTFSWRKLFLPLTHEGYEVIAVDIPPFGFSDRSPFIDHSPVGHAERLWKLLERSTEGPFHIVGHSMGARIAGSMGAIEAERAKSVFLVDGPFFGNKGSHPLHKLGSLLFDNRPMRGLFEWIGGRMARSRKLVRKALSFVYGEKASEEAVKGYMRPLRIEGTGYSLPPYFLERSSRTIGLKELKAPVHLIWGEKDRVFSGRMPKRFLKRYPYEAEVSVIQGAGHCPMETHPKAFLEVLFQRMKEAS